MRKGIHVFVEGGGEGPVRAAFREGFNTFLGELRDRARRKHMEWNVIPAGSRNDAYQAFRAACRQRPHIINILLVDAEGAVVGSPKDHVCNSDGWDSSIFDDDTCHLMVQLMEAWFLADVERLAGYYGSGFRPNLIPHNQDVEQIDKQRVDSALTEACRHARRGPYQKAQAHFILERIRPEEVRKRAKHCDRLFESLARLVDNA